MLFCHSGEIFEQSRPHYLLKKIIPVGLLLAFLINTMGFFVIFKYNQFLLQQEMFTLIRNGKFHREMILLKIYRPEHSRGFIRHNSREFSWHGRMYDIVIEHHAGDTTLFYCLHDKKEEALINRFQTFYRKIHKDNTRQRNIPNHALLQNIVKQALLQQGLFLGPENGTIYHYPSFTVSLISADLDRFAPPPEPFC